MDEWLEGNRVLHASVGMEKSGQNCGFILLDENGF
jgi:hypothetical protein